MREILGQKMYTIEETAQLLGITRRAAQMKVARGYLPAAHTIGRYRYISEDTIKAYLRGETKYTTAVAAREHPNSKRNL